MKDLQLLRFGFVVDIKGEVIYDHVVNARMEYANGLLAELKTSSQPVIARRCIVASEEGVKSPVFKYEGANNVLSTFQSAYYLSDALTRKGILPLYFPDTEEVKNLMPLLDESQKADAQAVVAILRARYIKPEIRHPDKAFLSSQNRETDMSSESIQLSDTEMLKIFGRLPAREHDQSNQSEAGDLFISDNVARCAS